MGLSRKVVMTAKWNDGTVQKWSATKTFLSGVNPTEENGQKVVPGRLVDVPEFGNVVVDSDDGTNLNVTCDVRDTNKETFQKNMTARIWALLD